MDKPKGYWPHWTAVVKKKKTTLETHTLFLISREPMEWEPAACSHLPGTTPKLLTQLFHMLWFTEQMHDLFACGRYLKEKGFIHTEQKQAKLWELLHPLDVWIAREKTREAVAYSGRGWSGPKSSVFPHGGRTWYVKRNQCNLTSSCKQCSSYTRYKTSVFWCLLFL